MEERTILELQASLQAGEQSSVQLCTSFLERIDQIDRDGPCLNSIIELNPDALAIAEALDQERKAGKLRGHLHGIPILIKDNIDSGDRMETTAGSLALEGSHAAQDAPLLARLRQAGVVLLGKTNMSEWANFRSRFSISGWSSRGGQTLNPYALDRNTSGSSSGSGAAVAANLCAAAVGTETGGSIVSPAQTCGIVGIKPTLGLVSRTGVIPISHNQDTAGPMARCVADAAALLAAMSGPDPLDPISATSEGKLPLDYTPYLDKGGLRGARIGVARRYFEFDPRVKIIMEACLEVMRAEGAILIDPVELIEESKFEHSETEVLLYDFKADLNAYLGKLGPQARVHSLADVIAFNEQERARVMPYFGQDEMTAAQEKGPLTQKKYLNALARNQRLSREEGIDLTLKAHRLDAIIAPTDFPAWLIDHVKGDHFTAGGYSSLSAIAGYPHITVPAGYVFGLPVGISFIASAWAEPILIKLAYAFEQATRVRRSPEFPRSVDTSFPAALRAVQVPERAV